ncbi:MAG: EB domain-containing protein, partial [Candidatus Peribacteraceae bacterium]|nr:EB domain-containing protein [Candidatus Peribacteraceae bacterium]
MRSHVLKKAALGTGITLLLLITVQTMRGGFSFRGQVTESALVIEASGPPVVARGTKATFHARVRNTTTSTLQTILLRQMIMEQGVAGSWNYPAIIQMDSPSDSACSVDTGYTASCSIPSLAPGAVSREFSITLNFESQNLPCPASLIGVFHTAPYAFDSSRMEVPFRFECTGTGSGSSSSSSSDLSSSSAGAVSLCGNRTSDPGETCEVNVCCPAGSVCNALTCQCEGAVPSSASADASSSEQTS